MKFTYQSRTSENKVLRGVVRAASKEAAYAILKNSGIKPGHVDEAPGFCNKLFGKYKRWMAICALCLIVVALSLVLKIQRQAALERELYDERAQLYGDPVVIGTCELSGWTNVFENAFDCFLARYAVPGKLVDVHDIPVIPKDPTAVVLVSASDLVEVAQVKRMVNGIKRELAAYLNDGGNVNGYLRRLDVRQRAEHGYYESAKRDILKSKDHSVWQKKNAELRAMGLPMVSVEIPEE